LTSYRNKRKHEQGRNTTDLGVKADVDLTFGVMWHDGRGGGIDGL